MLEATKRGLYEEKLLYLSLFEIILLKFWYFFFKSEFFNE